jgi:hypothetical protein
MITQTIRHRVTRTIPILAELTTALLGSSAFAGTKPSFDVHESRFIENKGQWQPETRFYCELVGFGVWVEQDGMVFDVPDPADSSRGHAVRMRFDFDGDEWQVRGDRELPGRFHYLLGDDPSRWVRDARSFERVVLENAGQSTRIIVGIGDSGLEYDIEFDHLEHLDKFRITVEGASEVRMDGDGRLLIDTEFGTIRQRIPACWVSATNGERETSQIAFHKLGESAIGFQATMAIAEARITIDPGVEWCGFLGGVVPGPATDMTYSVILDAKQLDNGEVILAGSSRKVDYPTTIGAYKATLGGAYENAVVTRMAANGSSLLFSTYFGGSHTDMATGVAIASAERPLITGYTSSSDFPVTPGTASSWTIGIGDAYVARLSNDGSTLEFSARVGGSGGVFPNCVAVDQQDRAYVAGGTLSNDLPTTPGAFDATSNGNYDGFAIAFSSDFSSRIYTTYLGGGTIDTLGAASVANDGTLWTVGYSFSSDYPTTPSAHQPVKSVNSTDAILTRISAQGDALLYSTFLGGPSGADWGSDIALDEYGNPTIVGDTWSPFFPTTPGVLMPVCPWPSICHELFVSRFTSAGALAWSTYFGGGADEYAGAIELESDGGCVIAGSTLSGPFSAFPQTAGSIPPHPLNSCSDLFVARLTSDASRVEYGTFFGGSQCEEPFTGPRVPLSVDWSGAATVSTATASTDLPVTPGVFDPVSGYGKAMVAKLDLLPIGVSKYGTPSSNCGRRPSIRVTAMPKLGTPSFGIRCISGPDNGTGFLALSAGALTTPLKTTGIELWVDPSVMILLPMATDSFGAAQLTVPLNLPANYAGLTVAAQYLWIDSCGVAGLSASNALKITLPQ